MDDSRQTVGSILSRASGLFGQVLRQERQGVWFLRAEIRVGMTSLRELDDGTTREGALQGFHAGVEWIVIARCHSQRSVLQECGVSNGVVGPKGTGRVVCARLDPVGRAARRGRSTPRLWHRRQPAFLPHRVQRSEIVVGSRWVDLPWPAIGLPMTTGCQSAAPWVNEPSHGAYEPSRSPRHCPDHCLRAHG